MGVTAWTTSPSTERFKNNAEWWFIAGEPSLQMRVVVGFLKSSRNDHMSKK